jgi:hypothetical protein
MAMGKFAVSLNSRVHPKNSIMNVMSGKYLPIAYSMRRILVSAPDFSTAVKQLETLPLPTAAYFTLSGLSGNEGIIITRDENGVYDSIALSEKRWFVIVTNWDRTILEPI